MIISIIRLIKYIILTRRTYWFTATSKTKARYARTTLGSLWLGVSTLLTVLCLGTVYGAIFKVTNFREYFIYLGFGLVIWTPISEAITQAPLVFTKNSNSLKNSRIKPIFFVCQEWAFQLQSFLQAFAMVLLVFLIISPNLFWNLGFSLIHFLNLFLFIFWIQLLTSLLGTKFTDLFQLLPVLTNLLFLLSPILYQKSSLGSFSLIADLNPIYQVLRLLRSSIINGSLNLDIALLIFFFNLIFIFFSLMVYLKMEKRLIFYL